MGSVRIDLFGYRTDIEELCSAMTYEITALLGNPPPVTIEPSDTVVTRQLAQSWSTDHPCSDTDGRQGWTVALDAADASIHALDLLVSTTLAWGDRGGQSTLACPEQLPWIVTSHPGSPGQPTTGI